MKKINRMVRFSDVITHDRESRASFFIKEVQEFLKKHDLDDATIEVDASEGWEYEYDITVIISGHRDKTDAEIKEEMALIEGQDKKYRKKLVKATKEDKEKHDRKEYERLKKKYGAPKQT